MTLFFSSGKNWVFVRFLVNTVGENGISGKQTMH